MIPRPGRDTPFMTLVQSLGRLPRLVASMEPTWRLGSVADITPDFVARHGIRGLIWDVDGTLTAYHATVLLPDAAQALSALASLDGLRHAILSNAPEWRILELTGMFPDFPVVRAYRTRGALRSRVLRGRADPWSPSDLAQVLARGGVALRKPAPELVSLAVAELGLERGEVVMVGDQHLTDIAGANLAGVRSIKLPNPARSTFPATIRLTQRLEAVLDRCRPTRGRATASSPQEPS